MELQAPLSRVCRILGAPRSTIYARASNVIPIERAKRGPRTELSDGQLTDLIRHVIRSSPFSGEGYRKVTAHLRRDYEVRVGRKRVLRLMRLAGLLAPQRGKRRRKARAHDGTIVPEAPDVMWGTDATMAYTRSDGWVWVFCCVDHFSAEGWASVAKRGDRFACLEPIYDAVRDHFGVVDKDVARGVAMRHDWGPQYTSDHFQGSLAWLGIADSPAFAGEPPCKGLASHCTSSRRFGQRSLRQSLTHAFDQSRIAGRRWLVELLVFVVGLVADEQAGRVPALDGGGVHAESLRRFGEGEHAPASKPVVVAGEPVRAA